MSWRARPLTIWHVEIRIYLDGTDPPTGWLRSVRRPDRWAGRKITFIGWLGLLRALSEVTGSPDAPSRDDP
jgi:hypothetical protein